MLTVFKNLLIIKILNNFLQLITLFKKNIFINTRVDKNSYQHINKL